VWSAKVAVVATAQCIPQAVRFALKLCAMMMHSVLADSPEPESSQLLSGDAQGFKKLMIAKHEAA
jgi:hypothetical protein